MIVLAKTVKGSLKGLKYQSNELKSVYWGVYNLYGGSIEENWREMRLVSGLNGKTQKPFSVHVISPSKEANRILKYEDYKKIAEDYAQKMGFFANQWRFDVHNNTDDRHIHIYANRIYFDGTNTVQSGMIGKRAGEVVESIAKKLGLRTAVEITAERKAVIKTAILSNVQTAASWEEFTEKMKTSGYHTELNFNNSGASGMRIIPLSEMKSSPTRKEELGKKGFKLSEIDRKLKIKEIENQLQKNHGSRHRNDIEKPARERRNHRIKF